MSSVANTSMEQACDPIEEVIPTSCNPLIFSEELKFFEAQNWIIVFETYPVWLLSLTKEITKKIYLPQYRNWTTLRKKCFHRQLQGLY